MVKVVLDVPKEFMGLVDTWRESLDSMKATLDRTGGGKAVDYAKIEQETSEQCRESEREAHRIILQALDIDVPAVVIGGIRYNRVGREITTRSAVDSYFEQFLFSLEKQEWNQLTEREKQRFVNELETEKGRPPKEPGRGDNKPPK